MSFFKFTTDDAAKRLRWVMVYTMLFDSAVTLLGQPSSYWHDPQSAREVNVVFRYCLCHGLSAYILTILIYIPVVFWLVSLFPRRLALASVFSFILGHYFGASTWLTYYWHFGMSAAVFYGIMLSTAVVLLAFPKPENQKY